MSVGEALSRSRSLPLLPPPSPPPLLSSSSSKQQEQRQQQQHQRASQHSPASSSHQHEHQQRDEEETKQRQCFPYSRTHSVAAASFRFPLVDELTGSPTGRSAQAQRGELVPLRCDSVVCPPPAVRDCYMREGICDEAKEFCMLEDHVKFGPAAAGAGGATPLVAYLDCSFFAKESDKYPWIWEQVCANRSDWGPWTTTRGRVRALRCGGGGGEEASREREREREKGEKRPVFFLPPPPPTEEFSPCTFSLNNFLSLFRSFSKIPTPQKQCVSYRKEQQSCSGSIWRPKSASKSSSSPSSLLRPQFAASTRDGRPPLRPLLCGPGLHCTGDAQPTPNTCVKARPSDICFQGPWW